MGEHTREIQIAGRNRWYRGYISVDSQWNVNDTTTRLRVTAAIDDKYAAEYAEKRRNRRAAQAEQKVEPAAPAAETTQA